MPFFDTSVVNKARLKKYILPLKWKIGKMQEGSQFLKI